MDNYHCVIAKISGFVAIVTAIVLVAGSLFASAGPAFAAEENDKAAISSAREETGETVSETGEKTSKTEEQPITEDDQQAEESQDGSQQDPETPEEGNNPAEEGIWSGDTSGFIREGTEEPSENETGENSGRAAGDVHNTTITTGETSGEVVSSPGEGTKPEETEPEEGTDPDSEENKDPEEEKKEEKPEEKKETPLASVGPYYAGGFPFSTFMGDIADLSSFANASKARRDMINFSMQFLGRPYVWGGESLTEGCDCSGFVRQIYAHFGIYLPRTSAEQAEAGTKIRVDQMLPGDLLFYSGSNGVYHVLMYIGDGKAINAKSAKAGIVISDIEFYKVCWACRFFEDEYSSTQAADLVETGLLAYEGDEAAQRSIIGSLAVAAEKAWNEYGIAKSVLLAQIIFETDWCSFKDRTYGISEPKDNNLFRMTSDFNGEEWVSPWNGDHASRVVSKKGKDGDYYGFEDMRTYEDIEASICDYASYISTKYPELVNEKDTKVIMDTAVAEFSDEPNYTDTIAEIVELFGLEKYDSIMISTVDGRDYTQKELELIWALVAQEDDTSYEGALAVISSVMNRADVNFEGFGTSALEQLTAPGQYCYSPNVSPAWMYQRRLNGNVPEFVKQAVSDCLTTGIRNNSFLDFRSTNATGNRVQIGCNWYF